MSIKLDSIIKASILKVVAILEVFVLGFVTNEVHRLYVAQNLPTIKMPNMTLLLVSALLIPVFGSYLLLYKKLKRLTTYLKIQGTSWEEVTSTVEFSEGFDEAVKLIEKGKLR